MGMSYIGAPEDEPGYWDNHGPDEDDEREELTAEEEQRLFDAEVARMERLGYWYDGDDCPF